MPQYQKTNFSEGTTSKRGGVLLARRRELDGREEHLESAEHCEALLRLLAPDFVPTEAWQEMQERQAVPPGCHVKVDLQTGKKMARREEQTADR